MKYFLIFTSLLILCRASEGPSRFVEAVAAAKPSDWNMTVHERTDPPPWVRSGAHPILYIELTGTRKGGYDYELEGGDSAMRFDKVECVRIWVYPKVVDLGWTARSRLKNSTSKTPVEIPDVMVESGMFSIYMKDGWKLDGEEASKQIPSKHVTRARFVTAPKEESWPNWETALSRGLNSVEI